MQRKGMKTKTINKIIKKKIDEWISTVEDEELRKLLKRDVIVTGGCITSMLLGEKINDYDVYFKTIETTYKASQYYSNKMMEKTSTNIDVQLTEFINGERPDWYVSNDENILQYVPQKGEDVKYRVRCYIGSKGVEGDPSADTEYNENEDQEPITPNLDSIEDGAEKVERKQYKPVFITSNAITLSDKIQIVIRFYGQPDIIHENYDFQHVTNYWTYDEGVVTNARALECILSKELLYRGSRYPLASIIRTRKFIKRGWQINAGQYVKMVMQLNELDLSKPHVLTSQLTGVDVAYFHELLDSINKKVEEDSNFEVVPYFLQVVEKIFD